SAGRCGTARCAQISAVSAGCEVPPNTTISRTRGLAFLRRLSVRRCQDVRRCLGARLAGRQAEALPDLLLDLLGGRPRVHDEDVLLAPEQLDYRIGLVVIVT